MNNLLKKTLILIPLIFVLTIFASRVSATESFRWPSDGYIGWKYLTPQGNGTYHNGIDIWSNQDGGWNNDVEGSSNGIYAVYTGQVIYIDDIGDKGLIVKHNNNLYTDYWHVKDRAVNLWQNVDSDTLMGRQLLDVAVHVHLTVSTVAGDSGHIDPTPYFGVQLKDGQPGVVGWMYEVSRGDNCGGMNVVLLGKTISSGQNFYCSGVSSVRILPDFYALNGSEVRIFNF